MLVLFGLLGHNCDKQGGFMAETTALMVGNGGREHALSMELAGAVDVLWYTGANAGMEALPNAQMVPEGVSLKDVATVARFAAEQKIDLTVVGPEQPLVDGLSNHIRESGLTVFGPSQEASILESSKYAARMFMAEHDIAMPEVTFIPDATEFNPAMLPQDVSTIVIKADGLAGGKGVVLPDTREQAIQVITEMLAGQSYGGAGKDGVLIEQRCHGPEVSMFVLTDGENLHVLPFTQDHKRLEDGDKGPNTGGMGAYLMPDDMLSPRQREKLEQIAHQSVEGMRHDGVPYRGVLYVGAMLAEEYDDDPVVIEYNVRFGDPETQVLAHLMGENTFDILRSTDDRLREDLLGSGKLLGQHALTVCLAAEGYPGTPITDREIYGVDDRYAGVTIHHGGTKRADGAVYTTGGRVLYVTGRGNTLDEAASQAYDAIDVGGIGGGVHFLGMQNRTDIGWQARTTA
jgi:phosphoribosylamine--glycine ligase